MFVSHDHIDHSLSLAVSLQVIPNVMVLRLYYGLKLIKGRQNCRSSLAEFVLFDVLFLFLREDNQYFTK